MVVFYVVKQVMLKNSIIQNPKLLHYGEKIKICDMKCCEKCITPIDFPLILLPAHNKFDGLVRSVNVEQKKGTTQARKIDKLFECHCYIISNVCVIQ